MIMMFSTFALVEKYAQKSEPIEGKSGSTEVLITFTDLTMVQAYFPDPENPFESTVILLGSIRVSIPIKKNQFEKLLAASRLYNFFSKITLN